MTNREAERRALRKAGILDRQRYRRWHKRRIDYYPSPAAAALIDALTGRKPERLNSLLGLPVRRSPNGRSVSAAIDELIRAARELPEFRDLVKSRG